MRATFIFILLLSLFFSSCQPSYKIRNSAKNGAHKSKPSGKYKNPTMFSRVNPFQGRAKAKLNKNKRKKKSFYKKRRQQGVSRKVKKPGGSFGLKRTISRKRLKSSGSRIKSGGGRQKKNKNLFKTKKK